MQDVLKRVSLGEMLHQYIAEHQLNIPTVAAAMRLHPNDLSELIDGRRTLDANWATRLAHAFNTTPDYWLNIHNNHQCWLANNRYMEETRGIPCVIPESDEHE